MPRKNNHGSSFSSSSSSSFTDDSLDKLSDQLVAVTPAIDASLIISDDHFTSESTNASSTGSSSSVEEHSARVEKKIEKTAPSNRPFSKLITYLLMISSYFAKYLREEEIFALALCGEEGYYLFLLFSLEKKPNLIDFEKKQAQRLKEIAQKPDTSAQQAQILYQLGFIHLKRQDYLKGIGLLNAARVRVRKRSITRLIQRTIQQAQLVWARSLSGVEIVLEPSLDWCMERANKEYLMNHRMSALQETIKILQAQGDFSASFNFQKKIQDILIEFINQLLKQCFLILGEPTFEYTILGLGSLGLGEATLHSDLEWAIVLAEDRTEHYTYMQHLALLLHLKILNLGETIIPSLAITSLNDYEDLTSDHLHDDITPRGFAIDGQMFHARKTPLGRPHSQSCPGFYLIGTPTHFSQYFAAEWFDREPQLIRVLLNTCFIAGSPRLQKDYHKKIKKCLSRIAIQKRLGHFIGNIADTFGGHVGVDSLTGKIHDLKFNFYRLPSLIFTLLIAFSDNLESNTTIERIVILTKGLNLSPEDTTTINKLQEMLCFIYMLRLHHYLELDRQTEHLTIQSGSTPVFLTEEILTKIYHQLIALRDASEKYLRTIERDSFSPPSTFLNEYCIAEKDKITNQALIHQGLYQYDKLIQHLKKSTMEKIYFNRWLSNNSYLINIYNELKQYQKSLEILTELMGIPTENLKVVTICNYMGKKFVESTKNPETYPILISLFINMGETFRGLLQYDVAVILLEDLHRYWSIFQPIVSLHAFSHLRGNILNALGLSYMELGNKEKAIVNLRQALEDELQTHPFCNAHRDVAIRRNNLGMCLIKFGDEAKGISDVEKAIAILKSSKSEYSLLAALMHSNLGNIWTGRRKWPDAKKALDKAKTIVESPNFKDLAHSYVLLVYDNFGYFYYRQNKYEESIFYYEKALNVAKKINELILIVTYQKRIAECYLLWNYDANEPLQMKFHKVHIVNNKIMIEMKWGSPTLKKAFEMARESCDLIKTRKYRGLTAAIIFEMWVLATLAASGLPVCWGNGKVQAYFTEAEGKMPADIKQVDKDILAIFYNIQEELFLDQLEHGLLDEKAVYHQNLKNFTKSRKKLDQIKIKNIKECQVRWEAYQRQMLDKKSQLSTHNLVAHAVLSKAQNNARHSSLNQSESQHSQNKLERKRESQNPSSTSSLPKTAMSREPSQAEQIDHSEEQHKDKKQQLSGEKKHRARLEAQGTKVSMTVSENPQGIFSGTTQELYAQGQAYFKQQKYHEAIKIFTRLRDFYNRETQKQPLCNVYYMLAKTHQALRHAEAAKTNFEAVIKLNEEIIKNGGKPYDRLEECRHALLTSRENTLQC